MSRTNLILNKNLIESARKISGEKTITGTIHYAISYFIDDSKKKKQIKEFLNLRGSKAWEGNLKNLRKNRI